MSATAAPQIPAPTPDPEDLARLIAAHRDLEGPLLPLLHAVQAEYGCIPAGAHAPIAEALNITRAELHGVISFYHDFRDTPQGTHVLRICRSEACQAMGAGDLSAAVLSALGLDAHGTTPDGRLTVEPVYCLGLCACAPAAMLDGRGIGRATPERLLAEVAT